MIQKNSHALVAIKSYASDFWEKNEPVSWQKHWRRGVDILHYLIEVSLIGHLYVQLQHQRTLHKLHCLWQLEMELNWLNNTNSICINNSNIQKISTDADVLINIWLRFVAYSYFNFFGENSKIHFYFLFFVVSW